MVQWGNTWEDDMALIDPELLSEFEDRVRCNGLLTYEQTHVLYAVVPLQPGRHPYVGITVESTRSRHEQRIRSALWHHRALPPLPPTPTQ